LLNAGRSVAQIADRSALALAATLDDGLAQQRVLDAVRESGKRDARWVAI
jgi:hypothetical protein